MHTRLCSWDKHFTAIFLTWLAVFVVEMHLAGCTGYSESGLNSSSSTYKLKAVLPSQDRDVK